MQVRRTGLVTLLLVALLAGAAGAHSLTYESETGPLFCFSVPREWGFRIDGDRLVAAPADSSMWFGTWEMEKHDEADPAFRDAATYLSAWFQDVQAGEVQRTPLNGMEARRVDGTATHNGRLVRFSLVLFEPRPKAICVALGVWADETRDRMGPIEAALGSLRPAPGG